MALKGRLTDEWWIQVDGEVFEEKLNLDQAFSHVNGKDGAFIIHASYAEADEPHWIPVGKTEDAKATVWTSDPMVCARCKHTFRRPKYSYRGSVALELIGYLFLILPGILLTRKRLARRKKVCPLCGSRKIVPTDSRAGRAVLES